MNLQPTLFDSERRTMRDALDLTRQSLLAYGANYDHWAIAFSGGKDSTATVTVVCHLLETGAVPRPKSLTVLYADTRMELPPLHFAAMGTMERLRDRGFNTRVVLPLMDKRFFVFMFGRGVPPSHNGFRWCTGALKVDPMTSALKELRDERGEKFLMLTGVRLGESAARDQRISLSCSKNGAECGQGYFQQTTPANVADTLAPLIHWRVCQVWDWLKIEAPAEGFPTGVIADVYGGDEAVEANARTGCVGCPVAGRDTALDGVLEKPRWSYLAPLKRLKPLYEEIARPVHRLRKDTRHAGPLLMETRRWALGQVLAIQDEVNTAARLQGRPEVVLIDPEELARIVELQAANTWPDSWTGEETTGATMLHETMRDGSVQPVFFPGEVFA